MATVVFNSYKVDAARGNIDLQADNIGVMLATASYTPDADAHNFRDDVTNEVSGTGYTAGGADLASKTVTQDNTNNRAVFDAADLTWTTATITNARYAILFRRVGGAASADPLIVALDLGANYSSVASDFVLQWSASDGILTF